MSDLNERAGRLLEALESASGLSEIRKAEARELIRLARDARTRAEDRISALDLLERSLRLQTSIDKVVSFRRKPLFSRPGFGPDSAENFPEPVPVQPILFICPSPTLGQRAALKAHSLSGRWSFVSAFDLDESAFSDRSSWIQLAGNTLFISDLAKFPMRLQILLALRLSEPRLATGPFVIARTTGPTALPVHGGLILSSLISLFRSREIDSNCANAQAERIAAELFTAFAKESSIELH